MESKRATKTEYYLDVAETVSKRSTCLKRHYGAVIVKDDEIISTGYNGAPRGRRNCDETGFCIRKIMNIPSGCDSFEEHCRSVHAEMNAIIHAPRKDMIGSILYLVGIDPDTNQYYDTEPCSICKRMIINAGIHSVYIKTGEESCKVLYTADIIEKDDTLPYEKVIH